MRPYRRRQRASSLKRCVCGAAGARLWGWRPNNGRRGGGRRRAICSAELMPTWHFCLCPRVFWGPPAAGLRGKRDSYGLDIHLNIQMFVDRRPLDFAVDRTPTRADEDSLPFLGAHEGAMSPGARRGTKSSAQPVGGVV
jgi:hypothetical protein